MAFMAYLGVHTQVLNFCDEKLTFLVLRKLDYILCFLYLHERWIMAQNSIATQTWYPIIWKHKYNLKYWFSLSWIIRQLFTCPWGCPVRFLSCDARPRTFQTVQNFSFFIVHKETKLDFWPNIRGAALLKIHTLKSKFLLLKISWDHPSIYLLFPQLNLVFILGLDGVYLRSVHTHCCAFPST